MKKLLKHLIPIAFFLLLVVFLVAYVRSIDFSQFSKITINWYYIILATLVGLIFRFWGVYIWVSILRSLGATNITNIPQLCYVYAKSWLGRYIPSPAAWMMGKVYFASKHGISKNKLAVSSLLEGALQVIVVMLVSFVMLIFDKRLDVIDGRSKILMFGLVCSGIILLTPKVFNFVVSKAYRIIKKKELDSSHYASRQLILKSAVLYVGGALLSGLSLFLIAKAVYPDLGYGNLFYVMGVGNLAGAVSMLAVFAPSGLGVREGIQLVLLSAIMPREFALSITIMTRLCSVVIDFIFYGIAGIYRKLSHSKTTVLSGPTE